MLPSRLGRLLAAPGSSPSVTLVTPPLHSCSVRQTSAIYNSRMPAPWLPPLGVCGHKTQSRTLMDASARAQVRRLEECEQSLLGTGSRLARLFRRHSG